MMIVLDTNVLYQALASINGASHYIFSLIRDSKIISALSVPVFQEYEAVLKRKQSLEAFQLSEKDIDKFLEFIAFVGKPYTTYFKWRPNLRDENDNMFIELAVSSNCNALITNNIRDFKKDSDLRFDHIAIYTPSEFVAYWRKHNENKS